MTEIKWDELLQLAKEKGIDAVQLRWMIDIFKPESNNKIEVPVSEDAEQAIDELTKKIAELMKENTDLKIRIFNQTISNHLDFASNEFKKSIPGEDIEKAADDYKKSTYNLGNHRHAAIDFKAGAEWQSKQSTPIEDGRIEKAIAWCEKKISEYKQEVTIAVSLNDMFDKIHLQILLKKYEEMKTFLQSIK